MFVYLFVELILSKAQTLKVGEVSLIDGKKSMCINVDGYFGGGQGPVWATEGTKVVFTTRNNCSLMEGICTKVYPDCLNVTIELTKANTWGKYVTGTKVRLRKKFLGFFRGTYGNSLQLNLGVTCASVS